MQGNRHASGTILAGLDAVEVDMGDDAGRIVSMGGTDGDGDAIHTGPPDKVCGVLRIGIDPFLVVTVHGDADMPELALDAHAKLVA